MIVVRSETDCHIYRVVTIINNCESDCISHSSNFRRLLREMGWDEDNEDDDYVITEDDVREFQKLSSQIKEVSVSTPQHQ